MASSRRTHLHLLLGLAISAGAVYLSLRKIDFPVLGNALRSADYLYLVPALFAQVACFFLKGTGWHYLLRPAKKTLSPLSATAVLIIGLMVNNLLPAKMGELARAYLMGEKEKLPKSLCLSTILVEHLLDILVLLAFLLALLPWVPLPPWLRTGGVLVGVLALGFIVALFFLMRREDKFLEGVYRLAGFFPGRFQEKIRGFARDAIRGLRVVTGRYLFYALALIGGMWGTASLLAYLLMGAFGLSLPVQAAVMVTVFSAFGKIIPSAPGAIGTLHYLVILVMTSFGIAKEAALAYAIVWHGLTFLTEVFLGAVLLLTGHLSLGRIARQAEEKT